VPLHAAGLTEGPVALLLGAEGPGLTEGALASADQRVRIPMADGVDSLNVATAAALAFYAATPRGGPVDQGRCSSGPAP